jgi:hypothetical protein
MDIRGRCNIRSKAIIECRAKVDTIIWTIENEEYDLDYLLEQVANDEIDIEILFRKLVKKYCPRIVGLKNYKSIVDEVINKFFDQ